MKKLQRYDGNLEMFCDEPVGVNLEYLQFLRWLIEQGRLEHAVAGPASGEFAPAATCGELAQVAA
ncbi:MAG TPA: hypothetical protein VII06_34810 [Chloroflexota bacterium]|jgi:hypothetical protein